MRMTRASTSVVELRGSFFFLGFASAAGSVASMLVGRSRDRSWDHPRAARPLRAAPQRDRSVQTVSGQDDRIRALRGEPRPWQLHPHRRYHQPGNGLGLIDFALRRASNIQWQNLEVSRSARAGQKGQNAAVIWFIGLSDSVKSTIATALEKRLFTLGRHTYVLDGDNVRRGSTGT